MYQWIDEPCQLRVQVYPTGQVSLVDPIVKEGEGLKMLEMSAGSLFRVRWNGGEWPKANATSGVNGGCPGGCLYEVTADAATCVCNVAVKESQVYDLGLNGLPKDVNLIAKSLPLGAPEPATTDKYTLCQTEPCKARSDIKVWVTTTANAVDQETIFELPPFRRGGRMRYLFNRISTVSVGDNAASFRNPPHFMHLAGEIHNGGQQWTSDRLETQLADKETEALLEHLTEHNTTAPFIVYRMIQRMVTSNPSPRYMKACVRAFRTGEYKGTVYSGKYADLGATVACILLDPEARSPVAEADQSHGMLREPLLKILHVLRALDYRSKDTQEIQACLFVSLFAFLQTYVPSPDALSQRPDWSDALLRPLCVWLLPAGTPPRGPHH